MTYVEQINLTRVPKHIAIIMDGNGRWAKERGLDRSEGHRKGLDVVHEITGAIPYFICFFDGKLESSASGSRCSYGFGRFWYRAGNSRNGREGSPFVGHRRFGPLAI